MSGLGGAFLPVAGGLLAAGLAQPAFAEDDVVEEDEQIVVHGRDIDLIGVAKSGSEGVVGYEDFAYRPLSRVGELVENVPGVIATQHSGTGKANQYFLRGFNLDHGTDFAGFVDGVPINLRTHGHGQGYLDFNFVIPELIERIDFRKGPYSVEAGDFSAAGSVNFKTVDRLDQPFARVDVGEFGFYRAVGAGSFAAMGGDLLVGVDGTLSNGVWELDENLEKISGLVKFTKGGDDHGFALSLSGYDASWRSTDQVPERAVQSGLIGRFGFIDPSLFNSTTRVGLTANAFIGNTQLNAYATYYRLKLTSNFTYFLDDPVNGDQFRQRDRRGIYGGSVRHSLPARLGKMPLALRFGAEGRYDAIANVALLRSVAGRETETVRQDSVDEYSGALFAEGELALSPRLRAILGVRYDVIGYDVDAGLAVNSGSGSDDIFAPKAALAWQPLDGLELYANYGHSFHSNDVRGASIRVDPVTREPVDQVDVIARAEGFELGARLEQDTFNIAVAAFYLKLDSELVFVGDAGTTEPNDATRRYGAELTAFWKPYEFLTLDASLAYTDARFEGVDPGFRRIPGAVEDVIAGGATAKLGAGFTATARVRHFGSAPLIEDNSVRSDPTTLVNAGLYWTRGRFQAALDVLNLFDSRDADITYFYASQLPGEASPVEDRHFHPVEPRQIRVSLRVNL